LKKLSFEFDFSSLAIKGRNSRGNTLSRHLVKSVTRKEAGVSTLGARDIWYDDVVKRLNTDQRGHHLGAFMPDDKILTIMQGGCYRIYGNDLSTHFDDDMSHISQYDDSMVVTALIYDAATQAIYLKRFQPELSDKKTVFTGEEPGNKLLGYSVDMLPRVEVEFVQDGKKPRESQIIEASDFIDVKSYKAKGKRLSAWAIQSAVFIEPLPWEPPLDETELTDEDNGNDVAPLTISEALENAGHRTENSDGSSTPVQLDLGF
jgi:topoisomerase-4 subunit A